MFAIACIGFGLGIYQLSKRWADDWTFDRREAGRHRHEALFYAKVREDLEVKLAEYPSEGDPIWIIHGLVYRANPELKRYVEAMTAYHNREAGRHDWAVGRRWAYVRPTAPPEPPPHMSADEVERRFGNKK